MRYRRDDEQGGDAWMGGYIKARAVSPDCAPWYRGHRGRAVGPRIEVGVDVFRCVVCHHESERLVGAAPCPVCGQRRWAEDELSVGELRRRWLATFDIVADMT